MTVVPDELRTFFRPLRFLFVIGQYDHLGGAERQALALAEEIARHTGARVSFLAWGGTGIVREMIESAGFQALTFPLRWQGSRWQKWWNLRQLADFIRSRCPTDILLPWIGFNCKIAALIQHRCGARFTWWNQRDEGREIFGSSVERRILGRLPLIVSNSFEGRDFLCRTFGLPSSRIAILNNGIVLPEPRRDHVLRRRLGISENAIVISMLANHTRFKDHLTLVRAFGRLQEVARREPLHLVLGGRHAETTDAVKVLAFDLGLCGRISLPGVIDPADELWRSTDIAVHSSITEGCPNAALEAMAHGLPVCGTRISGMVQALGEESLQWLAPASDAESLCAILARFVAEPDLRVSLGERNRARIATEFSRVGMCVRVLRLIREAIAA
jgi:glycosyltransferase involved in cell wall biosynthesis